MNDIERFVIVNGGFAGMTLAQRLERFLSAQMGNMRVRPAPRTAIIEK
jgi:NADH dehydrogenase FAD-containing subunit